MSKDEFLAGVRRSLGHTEPTQPERPYPRLMETLAELETRAAVVQQRIESGRDSLVDQFLETAQLRGWNVWRAPNPEDAIGYITALVADQGVTQVTRSSQEVFASLPLDAALEGLGIPSVTGARDEHHTREQLREWIIGSGMGITGADYAVAETGSVVVLPRRGLSRLVSLAPPVHVALVRPQDVIESLDDLFLFRCMEYHRNGEDMGSYLNFITGPSRTADIEMQLVVGVHGPKEVHLVMLG